MKSESGTDERMEVFLRLLLISELYAPPRLSEKPVHFRSILHRFGVTLHSSEFEILEQAQIGSSIITIAKYGLDYSYDNDPTGERICIEGAVTSQVDGPGNIHIKILSSPNPLRTFFRPGESGVSTIGGKT
jgi:hypothetical protein